VSRKLNYNVGWGLDTGRKRRESPNQDSVGVFLPGFFSRKPPLFVLADGMGGYRGGELASQTIVKVVGKHYRRFKSIDPNEVIPNLIKKAHDVVKELAKGTTENSKMGSTIAIGIVKDGRIWYGNVGDSRIYLINSDGVNQLSDDHSFVSEQVRSGIISPSEALTHPQRNRLTQSISAAREYVDPCLGSCNFTRVDILVFCSDGLWGTVTEAQIQSVVLEMEPQKAADKLIDMANANLGPDNISVIIIREKGFMYKFLEDE
jgi:protein phosphatase